jgi:phage terminase large subunit-like protein
MTFAGRLAHELTSGWLVTARPNQLPPDGDWQVWIMLAGRGFGKTRVLSEMANAWALSGVCKRMALVAATAADGRDVMVEGESGILACAPPWCMPEYQPTRRRVIWPNGAIATLYSAEEPERLRGPQHDGALCDELGSWRDQATWDMLMFGLRLGTNPRVVIATTPRATRLIRQLVAREGQGVVITRGSTYENRANLAPGFFDSIVSRYEGTRLGRQELHAELLLDVPGALWAVDNIDAGRREHAPNLVRVVAAIDPAVSSHEGSDETGIIVVGKDGREQPHAYVIEDLSGRYAPNEWALRAINAYHRHGADRIVAEVNQGGQLVENTIRMVDPNIPFTAVHASRGKYIRAEPVAALYEQGRVHHVGNFPELEDQQTSFVPDIDRGKMGSPDRLDALVWGVTELMVQPEPYSGLLQYMAELAAESRGRRPAAAEREVAAPLPEFVVPSKPVSGSAPTYPIFGAHEGEPPVMLPTRRAGGGIRFIPVQQKP